jgi:hypothetical protein
MIIVGRPSAGLRLARLPALLAIALAVPAAMATTQSGEQKDMVRIGHDDLQGRPAYQPNVILYPDGRTIEFVGTLGGTYPNPLKGGAMEPSGTLILDVTDPRHPVEKYHIPGTDNGQSQMVRMCLGSELPGGQVGHVYLLRNYQATADDGGYEMYDVTDVGAPVLMSAMRGLFNTHKLYWECKSGIVYAPGSLGTSYGLPLWRDPQSMLIFDWSHPASPKYLRTFGLPGGQPSGTGVIPPSLHGAISAHEHPMATQALARGRGPEDIIGNRVYAAWGVGADGEVLALDRQKLLPPPYGKYRGDPNDPTNADLMSSVAGRLRLEGDEGGHTSMPIFGVKPPSFTDYSQMSTRDIIISTSESTANACQESPHPAQILDFTIENSFKVPPGWDLEHDPWQGPAALSQLWVDPHRGAAYSRGDYCTRGARFGSHASEENFYNPYYGRLTFITYFTGGLRVWDIRDPYQPAEVAFYVGEADQFTQAPGYMTNNVEVDNRGYVFTVDRTGSGADMLELTGNAKRIGLGLDN